jgi:hypothetical protein
MPGTGQQASGGIIASRRPSTTMARFHSCTVAVRRQSGAFQPNQPIALMGRGRPRYPSSYLYRRWCLAHPQRGPETPRAQLWRGT